MGLNGYGVLLKSTTQYYDEMSFPNIDANYLLPLHADLLGIFLFIGNFYLHLRDVTRRVYVTYRNAQLNYIYILLPIFRPITILILF